MDSTELALACSAVVGGLWVVIYWLCLERRDRLHAQRQREMVRRIYGPAAGEILRTQARIMAVLDGRTTGGDDE